MELAKDRKKENKIGILIAIISIVDIGIYQSASALESLQNYQDIISSNISASNVPGFKKTEVSYEAVEAGVYPKVTGSALSNEMPASFASLKGQLNFSQGEVIQTNSPSDVALRGNGFFVLNTMEGDAIYTRNGKFIINNEGILVNNAGHPVQSTNGSVQTIPGEGEISIDRNGAVLQGTTPLGELKVVFFENPAENLTKVDGGFVAKDDEARPNPVEEGTIQVLQGFVENSNVKPIKEMVNMIQVSRAYEVNTKVIQAMDSLMNKAINTLGSTR